MLPLLSIFGGMAKGAATERGLENQFRSTDNQQGLHQFDTQQRSLIDLLGLDERGRMDRAQLGITAPQARTRQALLGSILQNYQPMSIQGGLPPGVTMPRTSGGMGASGLINDGARMGGAELQRQALMALLSGSDIPGQRDFVREGMMTPPEREDYRRPSRWERIGAIIGAVGGMGQMGGMGGMNMGGGGQ